MIQPKVTLSTSKYQAAHGHTPRGNGLWFFNDRQGKFITSETGTFSQASAVAKRVAKARCIYHLEVGS